MSSGSSHAARASYPPRRSSLPLQTTVPPVANTETPPKAIVIAISGCSSSGKTTLAVLLAQIFSTSKKDEVVEMHNFLNESSTKDELVEMQNFLNESDTKDGEDNLQSIIIHQDTYFVDKSWCPLVTFESMPADLNFVQATLVDSEVGFYAIVEGVRPSIDVGKNRQTKNPGFKIWEDEDEATNTSGSTSPSWFITGPDTDCYTALDITALTAEIQHVRQSGAVSDDSRRRHKYTAVSIPGLLVTAAQRDALLSEHAALIAKMKEAVQGWLKEQAIAKAVSDGGGRNMRDAIEAGVVTTSLHPKLCFIEGFLLYPELMSMRSQSSPVDTNDNTPLTPILPPSLPPDKINRDDRRQSWYITQSKAATHQLRNTKAIPKLMQQFDIKLFLPTSKETAEERRFVRDCYIDASEGGNRYTGQLWKSHGYFDKVAWANYEKEHAWLFADRLVAGGSEGPNGSKVVSDSAKARDAGVRIRPGMDAGIEETVEWSVRAILSELGRFARIELSAIELSAIEPPAIETQEEPVEKEGKMCRCCMS